MSRTDRIGLTSPKIDARDQQQPYGSESSAAITSVGAWLSDPAIARTPFTKNASGKQMAENETPAEKEERFIREQAAIKIREGGDERWMPHFVLRPQK
jgi:hypothetical protein